MRESNRLAEIWQPASESAAWPDGAFEGIIIARCLAFIADLAVILVLLVAASIVFGVLGILSFGLLWPGAALSPLLIIAYFTLTLGGRHGLAHARSPSPLGKRFELSPHDQPITFEERRADEQILEPLRQGPGALCAG